MDWEAFYKNFREPDFVAGYEIQNRLGGGAFGEVYKARKHSIGKPYAIKFLKLDDESQRDAVQRELEQVRHFAAIDHPNLVTIEDMGTVQEVPYLVMGYAGEDTLSRRLREGVMSSTEALNVFVQVARGVLALHDRRLVHFDLKPSNVFIKGDVARVGDYGLSKLLTSGRMTLSFGRGTPHYMAPEMLRSRADQRADIYSLGVILYECLMGEVPYEASTPGGIVIRQEDQPPEFPEEFPADLRAVIERSLRLDPDERYASVEELLEDLGQTARPGDSIRLDQVPARRALSSVAARADVPPPSNGAATAVASGSSQLRSTAAEFARGAAEVALGVWDGLRTPRTDPTPTTPMGLPDSAQPATARASAGEGPRARPLDGTVPVPPRTRGGPVGTVFVAFRLGLEVLLAVARGMVRGVATLWRRMVARAGRGNASLPVRSLRLALYVFLVLIGVSLVLSAIVAILEQVAR